MSNTNRLLLFYVICGTQALFQYDPAARDLLELQKIEPKNAAAKKELDVVLELCRKVRIAHQNTRFFNENASVWTGR